MSDIFEVYDFENEQHWLKGRTNGIGGSDASAVVGMNPYKSNIDLFEEYKVEHHEFRILRSKEHPFMQASLDGELTDSEGRRGVLEIKTTNILQSMQYEKWKDRIPDNYYCQVLHGLNVTGFDFVILKAQLKTEWQDGTVKLDTRHYKITREEILDDLNWLLTNEKEQWEKYYIGNNEPPTLLPEI